MPFVKGKSGNPRGKKRGTANKSTRNAREAIAAFVEGNSHKLDNWLDQIAAESPKDAFNAFMAVVEYHVPKLARQEISGINGEAIKTESALSANDRALLERWKQQQEGKNSELSR